MALIQEAEHGAVVQQASSTKRKRLNAHFVVTAMLCVLFAIMYLDRVNISAAASSLKVHFGLTNTEMGLAFSAFSWAYLASVLFGGWGARKYGAKRTLLVTVVLVGLGTIFTGLISGLVTLFLARLAVGLGEGPAFPAATQAMRNWYPPDRFGYIQGITHSASRLGAAIAPPIVAGLIVMSDWRVSFIVCGIAALLWAVAWWLYFEDDPREHPAVDPRQVEGLSISLPNRKARTPIGVLTKRMLPVTAVMFAYGWTYWVFVSWLPLYFSNQHGVDLKNSALLTSVPFFAGLIGNTVGGVTSDAILRRTGRNRLARCSVVVVSLLGTAAFLVPCLYVDDLTTVVLLLAAAMFFLELTIAPMYAIPMDISREFAGLGSAYIIMGVAIAGILSPVVFGWLIDKTGNWNVPFGTGIAILLVGAAIAGTLRPDVPFVVPDDPKGDR
ncbi:MAG: MFS transporter [Bradyrhizobiaceae bacterium]|nr:MAG: MFS transporter [Bradyrhizobiaceae bacterium]